VRTATTANVSTYTATAGASTRGQITGAPNVLDGVTLGRRSLSKELNNSAANGIYVLRPVLELTVYGIELLILTPDTE
jgi:hypothetical protein